MSISQPSVFIHNSTPRNEEINVLIFGESLNNLSRHAELRQQKFNWSDDGYNELLLQFMDSYEGVN